MNKKNKILVAVVSILLAVVSLWHFFADDLFIFVLSRAVPPGEPMPKEQLMPCDGNPASFVELGSPYLTNPTAEFATAGGEIYVIARRYEHGILLPNRGGSGIYIGFLNQPPTWNKQTSEITNIYKEIVIKEKDYGTFDLPAGRYWLWSSSGGDVVVYSCEEGGVSDPKPVWR
ncbi:MAG TPA: hypothetical protein PKK37_04740 [Candidatus Pacearchaeota archaeon]|nr:hypothetical protein [Candidatus Pacearchaeota archaeon]